MKLLLDTHAFLWFIEGDDKLSDKAKRVIEDGDNTRFLSVGSLWEMAIKVSIGKLEVPLPLTRLAREHIEGNAMLSRSGQRRFRRRPGRRLVAQRRAGGRRRRVCGKRGVFVPCEPLKH